MQNKHSYGCHKVKANLEMVIISCKTKTLNDEAPQNDILNSISHEKLYMLTVQSGKFLFLSIQFCDYEKGTIYNLTFNFPLYII